mmetsp:Transcript_23382/g.56439  ORF Transcript_23382/g.56439 Transcript_23382/m.56439 type:complete len:253 (+) Transcript_23382:209-967(+)
MKACSLSVLCVASASAFSTPAAVNHHRHTRDTVLRAIPDGNEYSRSTFLSTTCSAILSSAFLPSASVADDEITTPPAEATKPSRSIRRCEVDDDCVSTANIRDAKGSYSPPWTFEVSPDEAFARIKGVLKADDSFVITEVDDDARYVRAYAKRITVDQDEVEFLVKGGDGVVLFRSTARKNGSVSDFGANRKRIDDIRKRGAVFDLMGGGMTADSYDGGGAASKGNGPWGQLKAFYGLQKGEGFESVFDEEE